MKKLSSLTFSIAVAVVASLTFSTAVSSAGIIDQPLPLKVRISAPDDKKKIKIGKKLPVYVSCSKDCSFKATVTLIAPAVKEPKSLTGTLGGNKILTLNYKLTKFGRSYLRDNARASKLKVKFSAKDAETGKRAIKTRSFGLYK